MSACRFCLSEEPFRVDLFSQVAKNREILDKIRLCVPGIKITEDDALPKHVCFQCVSKLEMANEFIKHCILSERILRKKSYLDEGEPQPKARKTNVFSSLRNGEAEVDEIMFSNMQVQSDSSLGEDDVHNPLNDFKKSQVCDDKKHENSVFQNFSADLEDCDTRTMDHSRKKKMVSYNWQAGKTYGNSVATVNGMFFSENSVFPFSQQFVQKDDVKWKSESSHLKSETENDDQTIKCEKNINITDYLKFQTDNTMKLVNSATEKTSGKDNWKNTHSLNVKHELVASNINQTEDSDEEINQHLKILNQMKKKSFKY